MSNLHILLTDYSLNQPKCVFKTIEYTPVDARNQWSFASAKQDWDRDKCDVRSCRTESIARSATYVQKSYGEARQ